MYTQCPGLEEGKETENLYIVISSWKTWQTNKQTENNQVNVAVPKKCVLMGEETWRMPVQKQPVIEGQEETEVGAVPTLTRAVVMHFDKLSLLHLKGIWISLSFRIFRTTNKVIFKNITHIEYSVGTSYLWYCCHQHE